MKILSFAFLIFTATVASASAPEHGVEGGIPSSVWLQFVNFGLYIGILVFLLRKPVREYFATRSEGFKQALVKAEAARAEAERQKREVEQRLAKLQSSADENLVKAKAEAEELRQRIVAEAEALAQTLREDARQTANIELARAKAELREEVLTQAVHAAKTILGEKIADQDQRRLQTEFVEKIQVVRP